MFESDDGGADLEAQLFHVAAGAARGLGKIRDDLYSKLFTKEVHISNDAREKVNDTLAQFWETLRSVKKSEPAKAPSASNGMDAAMKELKARGALSDAAVADLEKMMPQMSQMPLLTPEFGGFGMGNLMHDLKVSRLSSEIAEEIKKMIPMSSSAREGMYTANIVTEHAIDNALNGTLRKKVAEYGDLATDQEGKKAILKAYDALAQLFRQHIAPSVRKGKQMISRKGQYVFDQYTQGCDDVSYLPPEMHNVEWDRRSKEMGIEPGR